MEVIDFVGDGVDLVEIVVVLHVEALFDDVGGEFMRRELNKGILSLRDDLFHLELEGVLDDIVAERILDQVINALDYDI